MNQQEFSKKYPNIPIIECEDTKENWMFYCQYCKCYHHHGKGEGHRVAHCHNDMSLYARSGYYLVAKKTTQLQNEFDSDVLCKKDKRVLSKFEQERMKSC